jgi:hypothetical protein
MPAIRAPGRQSRDVTNRPTLSITHRYIYFAGTLELIHAEFLATNLKRPFSLLSRLDNSPQRAPEYQ